MRIVIRPVADPQVEIDVTERLTAAIAEALWVWRGGNDVVNWLEAERHLARLFSHSSVPGEAPNLDRGRNAAGRTRGPVGNGRAAEARRGRGGRAADSGRNSPV